METTHFLNFLIPLISMNLNTNVVLPDGTRMPSVSCGDWSVCNAAPAFMMIAVTIIGVATTLFKEAMSLGKTPRSYKIASHPWASASDGRRASSP